MEWIQDFYKEQYRITEGMADSITKYDEALVDKVESNSEVKGPFKNPRIRRRSWTFCSCSGKAWPRCNRH